MPREKEIIGSGEWDFRTACVVHAGSRMMRQRKSVQTVYRIEDDPAVPRLPWLLVYCEGSSRVGRERSLSPDLMASSTLGVNGPLASAMGLFATGPIFGRAPHPFSAGRFQKIG